MVTAQLLATKDSTHSQFDVRESFSVFYDHTGDPPIDSASSEEKPRPEQLENDSKADLVSFDEFIFESESHEYTEKFGRLKTEWNLASAHMSSTTDMAMLPSYQQIIGMGEKAIPLILSELEKEPDQWFWALKAIAGEDPVPPELRGRVREMVELWIEWGHENGFEW
jgi:hypothetical protein